MFAVNILLALNVPAYFSSVAEGLLLVFAVLAGGLNRNAPIADYIRLALVKLKARRDGTLASAHQSAPARPKLPTAPRRVSEEAPPNWLKRHHETLKYLAPAYIGLSYPPKIGQ